MATPGVTPGITVSFTKTPQAKDDVFGSLATGFDEDSTGIYTLDVMGNDLAGRGKSLYSLDNGDNQYDLLQKDAVGAANFSANGATIRITADGKVSYDASTLSGSFRQQLQALSPGESLNDTFTYAIQMGNGTLSWATVSLQVAGVNDAPVITSATQSAALAELGDLAPAENQAAHVASGAVTFSDVDTSDTSHAASVAAQGTGYLGAFALAPVDQPGNSVGWTFSVADQAIDYLQAGQVLTQVYRVTVTDGHGATATQDVTITITGTNDAPTITSAAQSGAATEIADGAVGENATAHGASGAVTFADVDTLDLHTASFAARGAGYRGTFAIEAVDQGGDSIGWSFSVDDSALDDLQAGQTLTQSYDVTVDDANGGSAMQTVTITITGTNDAPVAVADSNAGDPVSESGVNPGNAPFGGDPSATGNVLANDTDVDAGDTKAVSGVNGVAAGVGSSVAGIYGSVNIGANGAYTYTLNNADPDTNALAQGQSASDVFSYTVEDSAGAISTATLTVNVTGTNDAPVGVADSNSGDAVVESGVNPGNTLFAGDPAASGNVLTNDTDPDSGATKAVSAVNGASGNVGATITGTYGTVNIASNGSYTYTLDNSDPETNALAQGAGASEVFSYTVRDQFGATSNSTLTINITGTNDAPVAVADTNASDAVVEAGSAGAAPSTISVAVVYQGSTIDAQAVVNQLNNDTWFDFSAQLVHYTNADSLAELQPYHAVVHAGNWPEIQTPAYWQALQQYVNANEGGVVTTGWFAFTLGNGPMNGYAGHAAANSVSPVATGGYNWSDSMTVNTSHEITTGLPTSMVAAGAYIEGANFIDVGAVSLASRNAIAYRDAAGTGRTVYLGPTYTESDYSDDGFRSGAFDRLMEQAVAWAARGSGTATDPSATGNVLANDTDVDTGAMKTVSTVSGLAANVGAAVAGVYGSVTIGASGSYTYTLDNADPDTSALAQGASASDVFSYTVSDQFGAISSTTLTINITGTNDAPVAVADTNAGDAVVEAGVVVGDATASGNVLANDTDVDSGATKTVSAVNGAAGNVGATITGMYGAVSIAANGAYTYTLNNADSDTNGLAQGASASEVFTYTVSDQFGATSSTTLTINITGTNDAPVAVADTNAGDAVVEAGVVVGDATASGNVLANDTDVDSGATKTVSAVNGAAGNVGATLTAMYGTVSIGASGSYTYTLNDADPETNALAQGAAVSEVLSYTMVDQHGAASSATLTINIAGTNDAPVALDDANALTVATLDGVTQSTFVNWVDWTSVSGSTVSGTITLGNGQTIGVTYSGEYAFVQTAGGEDYYSAPTGISPYTSALVQNRPTGSDIIALHQATQKTLTFSQPVEDLFFAIVSLNGNGYLFDQDFQVASYGHGYWGNGSATRVVLPDGRYSVVASGELHGVLRVEGAVESLTWTSQTPEYWNGFTVGTYGKAQSATASGNVLANDSDPDTGATRTVTAVNGQAIVGNSITLDLASGARVKVDRNGSYLYDEDNAFGGLARSQTTLDSFQYTVTDQHGASTTATATITVTGVNETPKVTAADTSGAVTAVPVEPGAGPQPIVFTVQQYLGYETNNLDALRAYAQSNPASYTIQTDVIDYTDDPDGFAGELPGSSRWPAAAAQGIDDTHHAVNSTFFARITASFSVDIPDTYTFRTYNDDGVFLLIDNNLIISDTGYHPEIAFEGSIALGAGNHFIELFFFEAFGEASLEFSAKNSSGSFGLVGANGGGLGGALTQLTDSGTISFTDVDLTDVHLVRVAPVGTTVGTLTAVKDSDTTGTGSGGQVTWSYSIANSAVEMLAAGETKTESFTVSVDDQQGGVASRQVDVTITGVNDVPVALADSYAAHEDVVHMVMLPGVLANDSDLDRGTVLRADAGTITSARGARVVLNADGSFSYDATNAPLLQALNDGQFADDTFTYTASDGMASSAPVAVTVRVTGATDNRPPVAFNDSFSTNEDTTLTANVLANDTDPDAGDTISVANPGTIATAHGSVTLAANGQFTYTPTANYSGPDGFSYSILDAAGVASNTASVSLTVNSVNDNPFATNDGATTPEDAAVTINVLANDTDVEGDTLTIAGVSGLSHGTAQIVGNQIVFTPNANFSGTELFSYTISDGRGGTANAGVVVNVTPVNDAPLANDDMLLGQGQSAPSLATQTLWGGSGEQRFLELDYGLGRVFVAADATVSGSNRAYALAFSEASLSAPVWTIPSGASGNSESFTDVAVAASVGDATFVGISYSNTVDLVGGKEAKADILALNATNAATRFLRQADVNGSEAMYSYTGTEYFNGVAVSTEGAASYYYAVGGGEPFSYTAMAVVKFDANGNRVAAAADPALGGTFSPSMPGGFSGGGSQAHDVALLGGRVLVAGETGWNHQGDNGARPSLWTYNQGLALTAAYKDTTLNGRFQGVTTLGGEIYAVGQRHNSVGASADYLVEKFDQNGNLLWRSLSGTAGEDSLQDVVGVGNRLFAVGYTNGEGAGGYDGVLMEISTATGAVISKTLFGGGADDRGWGIATDGASLFVAGESRSFMAAGNGAGQNDGWLLKYVLGGFSEDAPVTITQASLLANDSDIDGGALSVISVGAAQHGSVALSGGNVVFTPDPDYNGAASFAYTIADGRGGSASATASFTITAVNDAPVAEADKVVVVPHTAGASPLNISAPTDVDGDSLSITVTKVPSNGTVRDAAGNVISTGAILSTAQLTGLTFAPAGGAAGSSSGFEYSVADGRGGIDAAVVAISVFANGSTSTELIANGGFETGLFSSWTVSTLGSGTYYIDGASPSPASGHAHVGPRSGAFFAISDQNSPTVAAFEQSFTVPTGAVTVRLEFDMFVNNWSGSTVVGPLDFSGSRQYARVDLLSAGSTPYDTGAAVIRNFYSGADNVNGTPLAGWTHYSFDITANVASGGTYDLRFAQADTMFYLNHGIDNVSVVATTAALPTATELIANGGFETGSFSSWTVSTLGSGTYYIDGTSPSPVSGHAHVGPRSGAFFAISDQNSPTVAAFEQSFTVPTGAATVMLEFDMFVNNWSGSTVVGPLDFSGSRQYARVDLLSAGSTPYDTGAAVIRNFYSGADNVNGSPLAGWTHYSFDITSNVTPGGTYDLRFAQADTMFYLNHGIDNVSVKSISTGAAAQNLTGTAGNDVLAGGNANDVLTGNAGNDRLSGGAGSDRFDFNSANDRSDTITDFARGAGGDVLDIRDVLLGFSGYNGSNAFSGGYLQFASNGAGGTLVNVDSNGGANSFVTLATITNTLLTQADTANYIV